MKSTVVLAIMVFACACSGRDARHIERIDLFQKRQDPTCRNYSYYIVVNLEKGRASRTMQGIQKPPYVMEDIAINLDKTFERINDRYEINHIVKIDRSANDESKISEIVEQCRG